MTKGFHPGVSLTTTHMLIIASYLLDVFGSHETILESKLQASTIPTSNVQLQKAHTLVQEKHTTHTTQYHNRTSFLRHNLSLCSVHNLPAVAAWTEEPYLLWSIWFK